jgi:hypothetical protein
MSTIAAARVSDADNDRLVELARRKGMKRPELIRELMKWALDRAETLERQAQERARAGPRGDRHDGFTTMRDQIL